MKAVLCPVCNGTGVYQWPDIQGAFCPRECHGCEGFGWVEVSEDVTQDVVASTQNGAVPTGDVTMTIED